MIKIVSASVWCVALFITNVQFNYFEHSGFDICLGHRDICECKLLFLYITYQTKIIYI